MNSRYSYLRPQITKFTNVSQPFENK